MAGSWIDWASSTTRSGRLALGDQSRRAGRAAAAGPRRATRAARAARRAPRPGEPPARRRARPGRSRAPPGRRAGSPAAGQQRLARARRPEQHRRASGLLQRVSQPAQHGLVARQGHVGRRSHRLAERPALQAVVGSRTRGLPRRWRCAQVGRSRRTSRPAPAAGRRRPRGPRGRGGSRARR